MSKISQKTSYRQIFILILAIAAIFLIGGCGDSFAGKPASLQSQKILDELGGIETKPEPNIPMPEVYVKPPQIIEQLVGGEPEFKLFYFCKYHIADELKEIIHAQFATKLFDKKGKETKLVDYTVSSNPATNQVIGRCPTKEDVNAVLVTLEQVDVPPIQVKINCLVSEVYADKTLDHETTLAIKNLLGEHIALQPGGLPFGSDVQELIDEGGEVLPAFPGASLREVIRARMGLKVGYLSTRHNFTALIDLLESQGYLKILMNPTLEVVNGKKATVQKSEHLPLQRITRNVPSGGVVIVETQTEYIDVVDSLEIIPHVFADGTVGLQTNIILGSKLTPEGVKQLPIVTKKEIDNEENRVRPGESLIIGGIRKTEKRDVIRGVPVLKDIPVIGVLFSGRDFEQRVVETIFILTPTISTGGIPRKEMVENIQKKHEPPILPGMGESITDPFGLEARKKQQKQQISDAKQSLLEAEAEKTSARTAIREAKEKLEKAEVEVKRLKDELEQAKAEAENTDSQVHRKDSNEPQPSAEESKQEAETEQARSDKADIPRTEEKAETANADLQSLRLHEQRSPFEIPRFERYNQQVNRGVEYG
jgi:Flp pilus assembly secretin CpaC